MWPNVLPYCLPAMARSHFIADFPFAASSRRNLTARLWAPVGVLQGRPSVHLQTKCCCKLRGLQMQIVSQDVCVCLLKETIGKEASLNRIIGTGIYLKSCWGNSNSDITASQEWHQTMSAITEWWWDLWARSTQFCWLTGGKRAVKCRLKLILIKTNQDTSSYVTTEIVGCD